MTTDALRQDLESTVEQMKAFADECDAKSGPLSADDRKKLDNYSSKVSSLVAQIKARDITPGYDDPAQALFRSMSPNEMGSSASNVLSGFGAKAAAAVKAAGGEFGVKALLSGTIDVPNMIEQSIVRNPQDATTFLDIIGRRPITGTNTFGYLQQTVRTHNAAPVADGALKPTSVYTVEEVEDRVRVVAHLSEAIPERYFADNQELARFLESEMRAGLRSALEDQVANGDGLGENMTGVLNTSGTTAVAYATDTLTTARKAVTALRNLGEQPTAWVLNPTDDEAFDLLREDGSTGGFMLDQGEALWRIPRVSSPQVPVGTAILADWRQARLVVREDNQLAADRSGDNFTKNLVQLRLEGRYGFAVLRPQAFAVVDLTAL